MKKTTILICFSFSLIAFSQNVKTLDNDTFPPPSVNRQKPKVDVNKVYENPNEMAEFSGGINAFRVKLADAIVLDSVKTDKGENIVKTTLDFVVERDGILTDVRASGSNISFNNEAIKAVRSIKDKWKPAKNEGILVRSRYRMPLKLNVK